VVFLSGQPNKSNGCNVAIADEAVVKTYPLF
jgi:hypothetical protein